jgi:hypothetical protein
MITGPRPNHTFSFFQDLGPMPNDRLVLWLKTAAAAYEHAGTRLQATVDILRERDVPGP